MPLLKPVVGGRPLLNLSTNDEAIKEKAKYIFFLAVFPVT